MGYISGVEEGEMENQLNDELSREFIVLLSFLAKWHRIGFSE